MRHMTADERAAVVARAHVWLRTPWRHGACVLGGGVDCARLPKECYVATGVMLSGGARRTSPYAK